jgi:hypothetical protein
MRRFRFDTETFLIQPGLAAPPMVCLQYAYDDEEPRIILRRDAEPVLREALEAEDVLLIAWNGAYDWAVVGAAFPSLIPLIYRALAAKRGRDLMIRQVLMCIKDGTLGTATKSRGYFALASAVARYLHQDLDKSADSWRLRYEELDDTPVEEWPEEAVRYAKDDVRALQDLEACEGGEALPDTFQDEWLQTFAAFCLHLCAVWGVRVDGERLAALETSLEAEQDRLTVDLVAAGLMDDEGTMKVEAAQKAIVEACKAKGIPIPVTAKGNIKTDEATIEQFATAHPALSKRAEFKGNQKVLSTYLLPMRAGVSRAMNSRPNVLVASGRTSWASSKVDVDGVTHAEGTNLQNFPTKGNVRNCIVPRPGYLWLGADYSSLELRTLAQALLWICDKSRLADGYRNNPDYDPHTEFGAKLARVSTAEGYRLTAAKDKEFKFFRQRAKCFHPDVEFLTKSGWKRLDDLGADEEIAQATPRKGEAPLLTWCVPYNRFDKLADNLVHIQNESVDMQVTADHRMLAFNMAGDPVDTTPGELSKKRGWWSAGTLQSDAERPVTSTHEALLRVAVATQADGSYNKNGSIRYGFSKQRKIERLEALLREAGIEPSRSTYQPKRGPLVHFFRVDEDQAEPIRALLTGDKAFPWWWTEFGQSEREIVLDEIAFWDSGAWHQDRTRAYHYSNKQKHSHEVVSTLAVITGRKAVALKDSKGGIAGTSVRKKADTRGENLSVTPVSGKHRVVCFSVDSGYVLARQNGKHIIIGQCANFGYPGGLGAAKFQTYAAGMGIELTMSECYALKDRWFDQFPEMKGYFEYVNYLVQAGGDFRQFVSNRMRGGTGFCQGANTFFQGLAADGVKLALCAVSQACYAEPSSALFGSRVVAMIHDELDLEVPVARAGAAAKQCVYLMESYMQKVTPDIPHKVVPALSTAWIKEAEEVRGADGSLEVWG